MFSFDFHSNTKTRFNRNYHPHFTNDEKKVQMEVIQLTQELTFTMKLNQLASKPIVLATALSLSMFLMFHEGCK